MDSIGRRNTSMTEVCDGTQQQADTPGAGGCPPAVGGGSGVAPVDAVTGRPEPSRAVQRDFWRRIASGATTADAAEAVGVSWPVGSRWFRHAGGMPPISLDEPTGRYLSFTEREEIALLRAQDVGVREIARRIGRDPGTISRELRRNAATRSGTQVYRAGVAQWKAQQAAKRPKTAKLVDNDRLRGMCRSGSPGPSAGPTAPPSQAPTRPRGKD